jgi:hypothetical protein
MKVKYENKNQEENGLRMTSKEKDDKIHGDGQKKNRKKKEYFKNKIKSNEIRT